MSGKKLSSDEVPQKFIEWVLAMGCPAEKIPSIDKMTGMCRGQYYMAWRSLMEHVQAKDVIRHKRLIVFYDDVKLCQEKKLLDERGSSSMLPEQLSLWKQHTEVKEMVGEAEDRVNKARAVLNELDVKGSSKVIQRNSSRQRIADLQRRSWLLSQGTNELTTKIANLKETRTIAGSLSNVEKEQYDIQNKLDKCLAMLQRKSKPSALPLSTPVASSSIVSNHENETTRNGKDVSDNGWDPRLSTCSPRHGGSEKTNFGYPSHRNRLICIVATNKNVHVWSLVKCRGDVLWPHLHEKLTSLYSKLAEAYTKHVDVRNNRSCAQSRLARTAALVAILRLEATKNRVHFQRTQQQLAASIEDLSNYVTEDAFELLAVRVQRAYNEARVKSLQASLEELNIRGGVFDCGDDHSRAVVDAQATLEGIASVNKCIVKSREELERLIASSGNTERKIYNIRECLLALFTALHNNTDIQDYALSRGVQLDFPTESISLLRQFYKSRCDRATNVRDLSFNLEISDRSYSDVLPDNPTFEDELNVYLKKFNLEKNRKLVLDNGEKIWQFETVQALLSRLQRRWVSDDVTVLLHPSIRASRALQRLSDDTRVPHPPQRSSNDTSQYAIADIAAISDHEADTVDKMKKRITENLNLLQKVYKNLDVCEENLYFWSEHRLKAYISPNRTEDGKTYKEYEALYIEKLNW